MTAPMCPECVQGKHGNCTGWAFDEADEGVDCGCTHGEPVELRILTVRQPWAWAIIHGGKDVENRVRNMAGAYRGPVAIHAGMRYDYGWQSAALDDAMRPGRNEAARAAFESGTQFVQHPMPWEEGLGHIIGVVDLIDVHTISEDDHMDYEVGPVSCSPWAQWWDAGTRYHLVLANPRPLSEPIPYKGALGLRRLDAETAARVWGGLA